MRDWQRWASWLFLALGIGLFALAGYSHWSTSRDWDVETLTEVSIAPCHPKEVRDVELHFHNRSSAPIRVLGVTLC